MRERDIGTDGLAGKAALGLQMETGAEVGTGVLGAGHFQPQMAADLTHFPQDRDPLVARKDQIGGDAKTWQRWTKMKEWRSRDGEQRAGLGESGAGDTVSHWVPGAGEEASFWVEGSEGLVGRNGVGGAGGLRIGCSFRSSGSGGQRQASQTRPSSPGTSLLTSPRTQN